MFGRTTQIEIETEPTTELYVDAVLNRTTCKNHGCDLGEPCWILVQPSPDNVYGLVAVCNKRAIRAGFNARISKSSLVRNHIKRHKKGN